MSDQEMLHIATIGKPHGIKGSLSILSKTQPGSLIFSTELFLKTTDGFIPFPIDGFEQHHQKLVAQSPLVADRTEATRLTHTKIYCLKAPFFTQNPDQIYADLCQGYQVKDNLKNNIGLLAEIDTIQGVVIGFIHQGAQQFNLPMEIDRIDHATATIYLNYSPE